MSAPLVLAVPAKGRLQENAEGFFARSGLNLIKPRGARDYRGAIVGLDGVEVAYLSASEITSQLAAGAVHLGVTGEDLVREMIPEADKRVVLIEGLGFGQVSGLAVRRRAGQQQASEESWESHKRLFTSRSPRRQGAFSNSRAQVR